MAHITSSFSSSPLNPILSAAGGGGGGGSSSAPAFDDAFEDACSICLEPFNSQDPSTATSCKHEYHLQCILEWSQRSKECPICWRILVLKDPACQELLAAVETERLLRSRTASSSASVNLTRFHEDFDVDQHLASVASRAHYICRRERQRSSVQGPSEAFIFPSSANVQSNQQMHTYTEERRDMLFGGSSPTPSVEPQSAPSVVPPVVNVVSGTAVSRDVPCKPRQLPSDTSPTQNDISSFSESIKTKWFAASSRYKESISKSTRGIKEKLLARNTSVKELSKGVQREMSAGIAGVARMIERLDLTSKRTGTSSPDSGCRAGTSDDSLTVKGMEEHVIAQALDRTNEEIKRPASSAAPLHVSCSASGPMEVPHIQGHH
ncbi:E3 ubiquitin-protein ligase RHF1A isoform X2 [Euphorbia lathyris]|uniref:E3 ubiquitin-protein ligase RHF1A isoform X2 n=1 Tax=Euphorbia lathyris TaxID=212925 RepID=UPI00331349F2